MIAISVRNLGKKFKLYASPGKRLLEYISMGKVSHHTDFWALQDISFEIPAGTTLGILGQNGSGKSTLLSILAGVLGSSAGSFQINGKVSAILELGSGFHPEFSGRDKRLTTHWFTVPDRSPRTSEPCPGEHCLL